MISIHRKTIINKLLHSRKLINTPYLINIKKLTTLNKYIEDSCILNANLKSKQHFHLKAPKWTNKVSSEFFYNEKTDNNLQSRIDVNSFTTRSYNCDQLRVENVNENVKLCGWLEFHRVGKFIILRDGYGRTQLVIPDENRDLQAKMDKIPYESIIEAVGTVKLRPVGTEQLKWPTGKIELIVNQITVLNPAKSTLPFNIRDFNKAKEPLRMQYRYLDLRYAEMQQNMRVRSRFLMDMREFLINEAEFVDVETPTLFRATPGGAQEFIVPTRHPGQFYSLVQSPQQFKQMLMAGAIDRYFQIARCYRDEGARPDRQPEFTQLDIEMSFTTLDGVIELIERLLLHSWPKFLTPLQIPFQRMSYEDVMNQFGSDKPDLSIPQKLIDCTNLFNSKETGAKNYFTAQALVFQNTELSNSQKSKFAKLAKNYPKAKLVQNKFTKSLDDWISSTDKLLGDEIPQKLIEYLELNQDSVLFLSYGNKKDVLSLLGKIRVDYSNYLEEKGYNIRSENRDEFLWIVDFPLFESGENGELLSAHHPFTAPHPDDLPLLHSDPLKVRAQAYDLVYRGDEIGGGSIRVHDADQQKLIFDKLRIKADTMQHLLDALASGCPPHGGIALGIDRFMACILKTNSIRDVIAFPKGLEGRDPLSGAPVEISERDKKLYHLEIKNTR